MNCTIGWRKMVFFIISFVIVAICYLTWNWTDIGYRFLCSNQNTTGFCMETFTLSSNSLHNRSVVGENKIILLWTTFYTQKLWFFKEGNQTFVEGGCPESRCIFTNDKNYEDRSSAILFHMRGLGPGSKLPHRDYQQYWIFGVFESPLHTYYTSLPKYRNAFNLTFTYKRTSDLYLPSGNIYPKDNITRSTVPLDAINRTNLILWYVSNCGPALRRNYAKELSKYVPVDTFGRCGKPDPCRVKFMNFTCTIETKLKYKFYLAFENSRCPDYITEKFWLSLQQNIVPIVLGPKIADYEKVAPPHSFIHVDNFTSPKHLAEYIKYLDKNDEAYYEYHMWRNKYEVKVSDYNLKPYCKLCSMLHKTVYTHEQRDIQEFWDKKQCF